MVTVHTLRKHSNTSLSVQSMTRDLEHPYSPYQRPAGFLTHKSYAATPSQFPSGCVFHTNAHIASVFRGTFTHSDEFVQDLHLFPFYLLLR